MLGRCMSRAFAVAKRVRTETAIGAGTVSIASVAVDLARRIFGDLDDHGVLLLGAGRDGRGGGAQPEQGRARGAHLQPQLRARRARWRATLHALGRARGTSSSRSSCTADVVVASTASRTPIVTQDMVKRAMKARKGRTLFFVDIAVPRNVEPAVHGIDNVYVYNVDDLEKEVARGLRGAPARELGVRREDRRATRWRSSSPGRAA